MRFHRTFLIVFAILDAALLGRMLGDISVRRVFAGFAWWYQALDALPMVFLVSLAFSAYGLASERKWGLILSYVQFPVRFIFVYLSFGFLALVPAFISARYGELPVLIVAASLECGRLGVTVLIHRDWAKLAPKKTFPAP